MKPEIIQLNTEGEICPYPLILTLKKIKEIEKDLKQGKKILEIITDCPPTIENLPFELKKRGFQVKVEKIQPLKWKIIIQYIS
jgi:TusA-related sulfurtransferase